MEEGGNHRCTSDRWDETNESLGVKLDTPPPVGAVYSFPTASSLKKEGLDGDHTHCD